MLVAGRSPSPLSNRAREVRTRLLLLANAAVSTAGDAERYVDHRRPPLFPHHQSQRPAWGSKTVPASPSSHPTARTADALETTVYLLGPERGLKLVDETPGAAAIFVRLTPEGIKTFESSRFKEVPLALPD